MIKHSINGKNFRDYGVRVSMTKGIANTLKRKPVRAFEWAEYHGVSLDLSNPVFQEREIELDCFISGNDWADLFAQFTRSIRDEFAKPGTQRLLIEPFGFKPIPYEVFMMDEVKVDKVFKTGPMIATFTLKLIEPNPIKKVLRVIGNTVSLSYESGLETEIFWGNGSKSIVAGNAAVSGKPLSEGSIIIIAGNIEQITNFQTNAEVLWERL